MKGTVLKKMLSVTLAASIVSLAQLPAFAKTQTYYAYPAKLDFEDDYAKWALGWGMTHEVAENETYGRALKLNSNDTIHINFGDTSYLELYYNKAVNSGKHILEFDYKMPTTNSTIEMYAYSVSDTNVNIMESQEKVVALEGNDLKNLQTSAILANGVSAPGEWQHFEMMIDLDANTAKIFVNGAEKGTINLNDMSIHGLARISFKVPSSSDYALMDNVVIKAAPTNVDLDLTYTRDKRIKLDFDQSMPSFSAQDVSVRVTSPAGVSENVAVTSVTKSDLKVVYLNLAKIINGYDYAVSINAKSIYGTAVKSASSHAQTETGISKVWDFEQGFDGETNLPQTLTTVESETYRGKYLKYNGSEKIRFLDDVGFDQSEYCISYDARKASDETTPLQLNIVDKQDGAANFSIWWNDNAIAAHENTGRLTRLVSYASDTWYRIDNVIDITNGTAMVYMDGEYIATIPASSTFPSMKKIKSLKGAEISFNGGDIDNVRIKNVSSAYNASLSADENNIYVDFDETTATLSKINFTLTKTFPNGQKTNENFDLVYQNGTRAVLELSTPFEDGITYNVALNNIKSYLGKTPANTNLSLTKQLQPVGDIKFADSFGNINTISSVSPKTCKIKILYPQGVSQQGTIELLKGTTPISFAKNYNADKKCLTISLNEFLNAETTYLLKQSGWKTASGEKYASSEYTFTTTSENDATLPSGDCLEIKEINYQTNEITAVVKNMPTDKMTAIQVLRPGKSLSDIEKEGILALCYIGQPTKGETGSEFTFYAADDGEYTIYANVGGTMVNLGTEIYHKLGASATLSQNGKEITSFAEIDDNVPLKATLLIDNSYKNNCEYMLVCGIYKDNKLVGVKSACDTVTKDMSSDTKSITLEIGKTDDFDQVKVFAWRDLTRLIPIMEELEIK